MTNAIEIKDLTKNYGDFKLDHIDLTLPTGYIMGFIGENGAGKTTTIKGMLGLINPDAGEVSLLGTQFDPRDKGAREYIGVVLDQSGFPEEMTLRDIDRIMGSCYRTWQEKTFHAYAERFNLPEKKKIKEYSKGMKMKLSIAVALSHDSRLLILDEPTGGLDPIVREEILDIFLEFIQEEDHSIFLSSHILSDLEKICDYITFIHEGRIIFSESKDALLERYGVLKCRPEELNGIDDAAVAGVRKSQFGVEALVERRKIPGGFTVDDASIEDIMVFFVKEKK
ncbi:MAG: ABC transporter ATP-binding protein [Bacillota bacterium]|nr:ABC transporter ATP-binding protein [Bacillota bacterium]